MNDESAETAARFRRAYSAFNRGDFDAAVREGRLHPDFEFVPLGGQAPVRGVDGFRAWMEPDALVAQVADVREVHVAADRVLILQHTEARGATSGIELQLDAWAVWTLDGSGRAIRLRQLPLDQEEAAFREAGIERAAGEPGTGPQ